MEETRSVLDGGRGLLHREGSDRGALGLWEIALCLIFLDLGLIVLLRGSAEEVVISEHSF